MTIHTGVVEVRDVAGHVVTRPYTIEVSGAASPVWGPKILAWFQPIPQPLGGVFYASPSGSDLNGGTFDRPWRSLAKANTLQPGDTLVLRGGDYGAKGSVFAWTKAGTASAPVQIEGYPGERAVVRGKVDLVGSWQRWARTVFNGPTGSVGGPGPNGEANFVNLDGIHQELLFCEVFGSQWHAGVSASDGQDYRVLGCYLHDNGGLNGDYNDAQNNTSHGAYISPSSYGLIASCLVEHNDAKGIMGRHDSNHIILAHNTFVANGRHGLAISEQAHDWIAANNILLNNGNVKGGFGIACDSTTVNILERRNVGWHNGTGGGGSHWESGPTISEPKVADPRCVRPATYTPQQDPAPNWDHHLMPDSPCIGYGDPDYAVPFDIEGKPRVGRFDCGAYQGA